MRIKKWEQFSMEAANEGILKGIGQWLSKKAEAFGKWIDNAKGAALVAGLKCMLPKWLFDLVAKEARGAVKESALLEEWTIDSLGKAGMPRPLSEEEISDMGDDEYSGWLEQFAGSVKFKADYSGKILGSGAHTAEQDQALVDLLRANGISASIEVVSESKPSLNNINAKIDAMRISPAAKRVLRVACVTLFFGLLFLKGTSGMAAGVDSHGDGPGDGKLAKAFKDIKGEIKGKVADVKGDIKGKVSDIKGDIKDRISDVKDDIKDRVLDIKDMVKGEKFDDIKKRFEEESKKGSRQYGVGESKSQSLSWQKAFHAATKGYMAKKDLSVISSGQVAIEHHTFQKDDGTYVTIALFQFEPR